MSSTFNTVSSVGDLLTNLCEPGEVPEEVTKAFMSRRDAVVKLDVFPDFVLLCVINKFKLLKGEQQIRFFKVADIDNVTGLSQWLKGEGDVPETSEDTRCLLAHGATLAECDEILGAE